MGIEPTPSAWKAEVLPLNYTRLASRFSLLDPRSQPGRTGGGGRIRTYEGMSRQIYSLLPLAAWVPLPDREPRILGGRAPGVNVGLVRARWEGPSAAGRAVYIMPRIPAIFPTLFPRGSVRA
jgi:hypothetical protein